MGKRCARRETESRVEDEVEEKENEAEHRNYLSKTRSQLYNIPRSIKKITNELKDRI